jgi:hypothetical protein
MIPKTTAAWELSLNLGTEGGYERYIGTRYALFDTYSVMIARGIPARIYPCTTDGSENWDKSVLRTPEFLADKRRLQGPYTFGAQMLLNPRADTAQGFRSEWLRYWPNENTEGLNLYLLVDPASGKKAKQRKNDFTTMLVIGIGGDNNYYLIDGVRDRLNLAERAKWLFKLHRRWRPRSVGYEEYGLQADIEHMQHVMGEQNYRFTITPLGGAIPKRSHQAAGSRVRAGPHVPAAERHPVQNAGERCRPTWCAPSSRKNTRRSRSLQARRHARLHGAHPRSRTRHHQAAAGRGRNPAMDARSRGRREREQLHHRLTEIPEERPQ